MKRYCTVCRKIHEGRCERPRAAVKRDSSADLFRNTKVWQRKREQILERDLHCCRACLKAGVITARGISVHHIVPLLVDYEQRLEDDNLITLCEFHHKQAERGLITARELRKLTAIPPTVALPDESESRHQTRLYVNEKFPTENRNEETG